MVREISADEFDERFTPLFEHVLNLAGYPFPFSPSTFFPSWQQTMRNGIARTWATEDDNAVLGALFTRQLFTDVPTGMGVFWFSKGRKTRDTLALLHRFEMDARAVGCRFIYSSAFNALSGENMQRLYRMRGFQDSETVFRKAL